MLAALAARKVSALELLEASLSRQQTLHGRLNAVVATSLERARSTPAPSTSGARKARRWGRWPACR